MGDPARLRLLRGAARRSGDRGGLHLAPEHDALRVVDQVRSRRASTCCARSRCRATRRGRGCVRRGGRAGRLLSEAFMYRHNPQTKRVEQLVDEGAIGELRARPLDLQLLALRRGQHPPAHRRRGRRADGRRLLQRQRLATRRRRAGARLGEAWYGPSGTDWVFSGTLRFPGERDRASSTAARRCPSATSSR